jgi:hypothetical protein
MTGTNHSARTVIDRGNKQPDFSIYDGEELSVSGWTHFPICDVCIHLQVLHSVTHVIEIFGKLPLLSWDSSPEAVFKIILSVAWAERGIDVIVPPPFQML